MARETQFVEAGGTAADRQFQHVQHTDEAGHKFILWLFVDVARGSDLLKPAPTEDHNPITDLHGLFLIVGDEDRGDVELPVQAHQPFAQLLANLGIDRSEGFVEQEYRRPWGECPGNGHPLALATGQLVRQAASETVEPEELE